MRAFERTAIVRIVKVSINFRADSVVRDEVRGAVRVVQRLDPSFSRDELLRQGTELMLEALRQLHNDGNRFRLLKRPLRTGKRPESK